MAEPLYPLGSLGLQIRDHWRKHRPKMYAALEQAGTLAQALHTAQELTLDAMYRLTVEQRLPRDQAWELVREEWAFLQSEEDAPLDPAAPFEPL